MTLANLNYLVAFSLASFVAASGFCRIAQIDMKQAQYRYVVPSVLFFVWGASILFSLIAGEKLDWFHPIGLLGMTVYFWNTKGDWHEGMPEHYRREGRLQRATYREVARKQLTVENVVIGGFVAMSIGVAGVGAAEGRGDPLQIYSVFADPPVTHAGEPITIKYTFRRVRPCPGYVSRFVVDATTGLPAQSFEQTPTGAAQVGKKMVDVPITLRLDDHLPPGRYFYKAVIYSNCSDANYTKEVPLVPFVIAPRDLPN